MNFLPIFLAAAAAFAAVLLDEPIVRPLPSAFAKRLAAANGETRATSANVVPTPTAAAQLRTPSAVPVLPLTLSEADPPSEKDAPPRTVCECEVPAGIGPISVA